MVSRAELQRLANREKVALGILEKDYVITEVLKALSGLPTLGEHLVFKGGTALRKVYFTDWRYSEDLDFTVKRDMGQEELHRELNGWYLRVEQRTQMQLVTKMLHKADGYARVRTQFTDPLTYPGMIFMDLSFDEPVLLNPDHKKILTAPFPSEGQTVLVYSLEELLAEKMISLLERGKSRDYYDVWRLLKEHPADLDFGRLAVVLPKKLAHKGLSIGTANDFLPKEAGDLKAYWDEDLGQQIRSLPPLDEVLLELRDMLDKFLSRYLS